MNEIRDSNADVVKMACGNVWITSGRKFLPALKWLMTLCISTNCIRTFVFWDLGQKRNFIKTFSFLSTERKHRKLWGVARACNILRSHKSFDGSRDLMLSGANITNVIAYETVVSCKSTCTMCRPRCFLANETSSKMTLALIAATQIEVFACRKPHTN